MSVGNVIRSLGAAVTLTWVQFGTPFAVPPASADPCPDSEVVFARGSGQPIGLGDVGEAFIDSLREQVPGRSIQDYPVNYPATHDYRDSSAAGEKDATAHIESMVANCPHAKLVLGGYSQGATVIEMSTNSLPPEVANHVAAVALFGTPTSTYSGSLLGGPLPVLAAPYRPKSIDLCIPDDIICAEGGNMIAHLQYIPAGMADEAATFAASRLSLQTS